MDKVHIAFPVYSIYNLLACIFTKVILSPQLAPSPALRHEDAPITSTTAPAMFLSHSG